MWSSTEMISGSSCSSGVTAVMWLLRTCAVGQVMRYLRRAFLGARRLELGEVVRLVHEHLRRAARVDRLRHLRHAHVVEVLAPGAHRERREAPRSCASTSSARSSSSSRGTIRDTMPWRSASSASSTRPVSTRSETRPGPQIWNRRAVPPESGTTPCSSSGSRNLASSAAMRTSHSSVRSNPPPMHHPWIAHTTGTGGGTMSRSVAAEALGDVVVVALAVGYGCRAGWCRARPRTPGPRRATAPRTRRRGRRSPRTRPRAGRRARWSSR